MKKEHRDLLRIRAIALAKEPEQAAIHSDVVDVVLFRLGNETYCIESAFVREVVQLNSFTTLPGVPAHIFALVNVGGQIIPVIDLAIILNLPGKGLGELNKVIILQNDQMEFGILADSVHGNEVLALDAIKGFVSPAAGGG